MNDIPAERDFREDVAFLQQYVETHVLRNSEGGAVAVVPQYQGRTMTSASREDGGASYGYLNYDQIASPERDAQINLYGGEDRVWISPEGGQYSVFFDPGAPMDFAHWRTPPVLDSEAFVVNQVASDRISLSRSCSLTNWSGFRFDLEIDRTVKLLDRAIASEILGCPLDGVAVCAHESHNIVKNLGDGGWRPDTGLIGIWILCMSKPSPAATLVVPFQSLPEEDLGQIPDAGIVNADYFGKLDQRRLKIDRERNLLFFLGDGQHRSKLGLTWNRVTPRLGSWDPQRQVLSIVEFNLPRSAPHGYNNNLWEMQERPYDGDVINCYNDGLNESGTQLGPGGFYELETIGPALALSPGDAYTHIHRTMRMEGNREALSGVAKHVLGVGLETIESQFRR